MGDISPRDFMDFLAALSVGLRLLAKALIHMGL